MYIDGKSFIPLLPICIYLIANTINRILKKFATFFYFLIGFPQNRAGLSFFCAKKKIFFTKTIDKWKLCAIMKAQQGRSNKEVLRKRKEQESFRKKISNSESDDLLKVVWSVGRFLKKKPIRNEEAKKKRKKKNSNGTFFGKPFEENETAFHPQSTVSRTETIGKANTESRLLSLRGFLIANEKVSYPDKRTFKRLKFWRWRAEESNLENRNRKSPFHLEFWWW